MNPDVHTQLTKALDLLLDVICIVDAEGRFVAVSAACEQVFGYRPEEMSAAPSSTWCTRTTARAPCKPPPAS